VEVGRGGRRGGLVRFPTMALRVRTMGAMSLSREAARDRGQGGGVPRGRPARGAARALGAPLHEAREAEPSADSQRQPVGL